MLSLLHLLLLVVTGPVVLPAVPPPSSDAHLAKVQRILPGPQIVLAGAPQRTLRLAGVRPPNGAEGDLAHALTAALLSGESIRYELHPSGAVVYRVPDGLCLNVELVRSGLLAPEARLPTELGLLRAYGRHGAARGRWWAKPSSPADGVVYVTRTGTRYHRADCPHARDSGRPIPLQEAGGRYRPCQRCMPSLSTELPTATANPNPPTTKP